MLNDKGNIKLLDQVLMKNRGYTVKIPKRGESVVLLYSGGLDSTCLWNILLEKYGLHVYPLYIASNRILPRIRRPDPLVFYSGLFRRKHPALFHPIKTVRSPIRFSFSNIFGKHYGEKLTADLKLLIPNIHPIDSSHHVATIIDQPSRLGHYMFSAYDYLNTLRYQYGVKTRSIFIALTHSDSLFLRESSLAAIRAINVSLCLTIGDFEYQIVALSDPSFSYSKKKLIEQAIRSGVSLSQTVSCIRSGFFQCGNCYNCYDRIRVFRETNYKDKTVYDPFIPFRIRAENALKKFSSRFFPGKRAVASTAKRTGLKPDTKIYLSKNVIIAKVNHQNFLRNNNTGVIERLNEPAFLILKTVQKKPSTPYDLARKFKRKHPKEDMLRLRNEIIRYIALKLKEGTVEFYGATSAK